MKGEHYLATQSRAMVSINFLFLFIIAQFPFPINELSL